MDQLPPLGRTIGEIVGPTTALYTPLVAKHRPEIEATPRQTHSYGPHPRQQLDIYSPSSPPPPPPPPAAGTLLQQQTPILVFLYGGGFANGDKVNEAQPVFFKNVGYFFAEKLGLETIVVDYRLVEYGAKFPSGAEDLDTALHWIDRRYRGSSSSSGPAQKRRDLYVLGNSAGVIHLCTWLFEPAFQRSRRGLVCAGGTSSSEEGGVKLVGAILLGALYHFVSSSSATRQNLAPYLGSDVDETSPVASLKRAQGAGELASASSWPRILIIDSEFDPEDILGASQDFIRLLNQSGAVSVEYFNVKGHNHISPPLALGTAIDKEEEWACRLGSWLKTSG